VSEPNDQDSKSPLVLSYRNSAAETGGALPAMALFCSISAFALLAVFCALAKFLLVEAVLLFPALSLAGTVLGAIAFRQKTHPYRSRARAAFILGTMGLFFSGALTLTLPFLGRAHPQAPTMRCKANLKNIGLAIQLYCNSNGGHYPPTLKELMVEEEVGPQLFVCPASRDTPAVGPTTRAAAQTMMSTPGHLSYVYRCPEGAPDATSGNRVLVYEPLGNHKDEGMNVLFGDGHVETIPKARAERLMAQLNAGSATAPTER